MPTDQVKLLSQNQVWIQKIKEAADKGPNTYTFEQPDTKWLFKVIFEKRKHLVMHVFSVKISLIHQTENPKVIDHHWVLWQEALEEINYENSM